MAQPLVILGASARAAAQSAVAAGYQPWCIDLFADRDLRAIAPVRVCPPDQYPAAMLKLIADAPPGAPVLLTGAMENHSEVVEAVAFDHPLLGSAAEAIRRVRHPMALPSLPAVKGLKFCKTRTHSGLGHRLSRLTFGVWGRTKYLLKPRRSAGGMDITWWTPGMRIGREHYIQQYVRGTPYAAVFTADGWSASLLGVTEQLIGEPAFGTRDFRYCGSIGPVQLSESARAALSHLAVQLTQKFDVRGLFGVDLIMDWRGNLWPIEVNPRYTSSVEVLEKATRQTALGRAIVADKAKTRAGAQQYGKAILFAKQPVTLPDLYDLAPRDRLADVPDAGVRVGAGKPICTVFANAPTRDACHQSLVELANQIYQRLTPA